MLCVLVGTEIIYKSKADNNEQLASSEKDLVLSVCLDSMQQNPQTQNESCMKLSA